MTVQITILGLGQVGTSIGLALANKKEAIVRVGNDRDPGIARRSQKMGAVDQIQFNLPSAVSKADAVILCLPVDEIKNTLEVIVKDLKEGCVLIDTSPVKVGVAAWASQLLPKERFFVTMTPSLNPAYLEESAHGIDAAHADLFQNSLMAITSLPDTQADALKLATDLATLLGATPFFTDPYESDGLLAAVHLLPHLLAAALVEATTSQPGWGEARKMAGQAYARVSYPLLEPLETEFFGQAALLNKANTVRVLDNAIAALQGLRKAVADENEDELTRRIRAAVEARAVWQVQRQKGDWGMMVTSGEPLPTSGDILGRLIGWNRKPKPKK
jgi:prephenate dehydrogenase